MRKKLLLAQPWLLTILLLPMLSLSQVSQEWVSRYTGDFNAPDRANALALDNKGNVYVTGYTTATGQRVNFATIKYDDDGRMVWNKQYNGPANGEDIATDIAVDRFNNIYVAGRSTGSDFNFYITLIKYDERGDTKWVRRYNSPGEPTALTVDHHGNIYVTGINRVSITSSDYITLKYNKNGVLQWETRYDNGGSDDAKDIAVDAKGNVYVTGQSSGSGTDYDYATIKYNSNGVQQWVQRYDAANLEDVANALAVDASGNVYVTGASTSQMVDDFVFLVDYVTIKYNTNGNRLWVSRYDGQPADRATDIEVDAAGNVYITGSSGGADEDPENDYATVKYNAAGVQQWAAVFEGPDIDFQGGAVALDLDASGNVYVAGSNELDYITLKYNNNGTEQWVRRYDGPGNDQDYATDMAVDEAGNVYVTGGSRITPIEDHDDYATIKYTTNGNTDWVRRYNSSSEENAGLPDGAVDVAVTNGYIYVTGSSTRNRTGLDYTTIRYNNDGSRRWVRHYNGEGTGNDEAQAMAVDAAGNVYVTGSSWGDSRNRDIATIAYDNNGNTRWVRRFEGTGFDDFASDIAVDRFGNVYVTGWTHSSITNSDYVTIKHDRNGNILWVRRYNGPSNSFDRATALAVDASGNVYVTGSSTGEETGTDYATIKYSTNGNQLWAARYNGPANSFEEANDLALDNEGNVYVTGGSPGNTGSYDFATVKYNTNGVQQWVTRYENGFIATAIAVDEASNVYISGDATTIKYNTAGVQQWEVSNNFGANDLALDNNGNVYVTGGSTNYTTAKYDNNGVQQWLITYQEQPGGAAAALALDEERNVYVTGRSLGVNTDNDYATVKYVQTTEAITSTEEKPGPAELTAERSFRILHTPNPVATNARIQYELPTDGHVSIILYDAMGRQVSTLVNAAHKAGNYTINYDASRLQKGTYYYQIRVNTPKKQWLQTHSMAVMR